MMKQPIFPPACLLFCTIACLPLPADAASPDARACNLQGREIALRIREEVIGDLSAADRGRIAAIAEEVCAEYDPGTAAEAPAASPLPVVSRPAAPQAAPQAVAAPAAEPADPADAEEEEDGGLFDIRIIDPEDRVQRPGLKRP